MMPATSSSSSSRGARRSRLIADHPLERALSVPVVARIGGTVFADFSIDLALPRDGALSVDWIKPEATLTGEPAVDAIPRVAVLALGAQVADKVCALFERHGPGGHASSRARDLADIAMIATQEDIDGTELAAQLRREERRRLDAQTLVEALPSSLRLADEQIADWERLGALANIAKHARATLARLEVSMGDDELLLRVSDDGVGGADQAGTGLSRLRDRIHALDGHLHVHSPRGAGTIIDARLLIHGTRDRRSTEPPQQL